MRKAFFVFSISKLFSIVVGLVLLDVHFSETVNIGFVELKKNTLRAKTGQKPLYAKPVYIL